MVELADTSDLGSDARKRVEVQVLLPAYAFAKDVFSAFWALFSLLGDSINVAPNRFCNRSKLLFTPWEQIAIVKTRRVDK